MLSCMGYQRFSNLIEEAIINVYEEGKVLTKDVGGNATTSQFTKRIIDEIDSLNAANFR